MEENSTTDAAPLFAGEAWFDPIEAELRERVRLFLEEMIAQEATAALGRGRYQRGAACRLPKRHAVAAAAGLVRTGGDRGSPGPAVGSRWHEPGMAECGAAALRPDDSASRGADCVGLSRRHQHPAGANTRRVKRALAALFKGAVGKDVVSRIWRKVKTDWEAWTQRDLAQEESSG